MRNMMRTFLGIVTAIAAIVFSFQAVADTIGLDSSFGAAGYTIQSFSSKSDALSKILKDSSGRIYAVAHYGDSPYSILVARFGANGLLDSSFGTGGSIVVGVSTYNYIYYAYLDEANGQMIVAGCAGATQDTNDFFVAKINLVTGVVDSSSFAGLGGDNWAYGAAMDSSHRIIVVGYQETGRGTGDVAVVRFNFDGSLDTGFDDDGKATYNLGYSLQVVNTVVVAASSGKIYMAGYVPVSPLYNSIVIALDDDGDLDTAGFGSGLGFVFLGLTTDTEIPRALKIGTDSKILVGGDAYTTSAHDYNIFLARLDTAGNFDTGFGSGGIKLENFSSLLGTTVNPGLLDMSIQSSGTILVAGDVGDNSNTDGLLVRFSSSGTLDTTFNTTGYVIQDFDGQIDMFESFIENTDGSIYVGGYTRPTTSYNTDVLLAKYGLATTVCYPDGDNDGYGNLSGTPVSAVTCSAGTAPATMVDCDDARADVNPAATEICNRVDDNCDGSIDESGATGEITWYQDSDHDGFGNAAATISACTKPTGYVRNSVDCNDANRRVNPRATEICGGPDVNCDEVVTACDSGDGDSDGYTSEDGDCDDANADMHPGAAEVCDGLDNDCNGTVDDNPTDGTVFYADADGDGFGNSNSLVTACWDEPEDGYAAVGGDCDDAAATTNPNYAEVCGDSIDQDCSGADKACCGNGILDSGEACDDGNVIDSDLCTSACAVASGVVIGDTATTTGTTATGGLSEIGVSDGTATVDVAGGGGGEGGCGCDMTASFSAPITNMMAGVIVFIGAALFGIRRRAKD